jgi:hypothetical protein
MSASFTVAEARGQSAYDPRGQRPPSTPPDSFVDYTLKRVNPTDTNYGQRLDEGRRMLLDETVKNAYFWSNLTALGLLGCFFAIIFHQHRIQVEREWAMADVISQYEQALARSNKEIEDATKRNSSLAQSLAALQQSAPRQPLTAETNDRVRYRATGSHAAHTQSRATATSKTDDAKQALVPPIPITTAASPSGQIALFKPEVELVTKVNALEQQLGRSQEAEKQLRRQLSETGRKLQAAQEKNRAVKVE